MQTLLLRVILVTGFGVTAASFGGISSLHSHKATKRTTLCLSPSNLLFLGEPSYKTFARHRSNELLRRHAEKSNSNSDGNKGMEDAFRGLENLESLDDSTPAIPSKKGPDEAFAKALNEFDLKDIVDSPPPPVSPESEVSMYRDMVSELEDTTEDDLYSNVLGAMDMKPTKKSTPEFDSNRQDNDEFMQRALDEAIKEAKEKENVQLDAKALMNDQDLRNEIEEIFDQANAKLLQGLEEIRSEQQKLVNESSELSAQRTKNKMAEENQRLAMAQANVEKMLERVNQETREVEKAVEELQQAQNELESQGGATNQLLELRSGGIVKQAAVVGAFLFTVRSAVETMAFMEGDSSHLMPAALQGAIAIACVVALLVL